MMIIVYRTADGVIWESYSVLPSGYIAPPGHTVVTVANPTANQTWDPGSRSFVAVPQPFAFRSGLADTVFANPADAVADRVARLKLNDLYAKYAMLDQALSAGNWPVAAALIRGALGRLDITAAEYGAIRTEWINAALPAALLPVGG